MNTGAPRQPDWKRRVLILTCVAAAPFVSFLLRQDYQVVSGEALLLIGVLAGCAAAAAALFRGWGFHALVAGCAGLASSTPVARGLSPWFTVPPLWCGAVCALALLTAIAATGGAAYRGLVVYCVAFALTTSRPARWSAPPPSEAGSPAHILHLVLDEQIGVAGLPGSVPRCQEASTRIQAALSRWRFTSFPNAYSNYPMTLDSLPSLFNGRILNHSHQLVTALSGQRTYQLTGNLLAGSLRAQGYEFTVVQHGSLDLTGGVPATTRIEFDDRLGNLQDAQGSVLRKAEWLLAGYQAEDPPMRRLGSFFPFRVGNRMLGPLAQRHLWPQGVLAAVRAAPKPTYFLVHVMSPHTPYLIRKDGSIRSMDEWARDRPGAVLADAAWAETYSRYCEQVDFLWYSLDGFLAQLKSHGLLDSMTAVIHGDHGSRIRRGVPLRGLPSPELYDYSGEPGSRDVFDRFSALAAVKLPGQTLAATNPSKLSLLRFFERHVPFWPSQRETAGADEAYLFDAATHLPHPVPVLKHWR